MNHEKSVMNEIIFVLLPLFEFGVHTNVLFQGQIWKDMVIIYILSCNWIDKAFCHEIGL